jgi:uroporphyrinogen-III synthase
VRIVVTRPPEQAGELVRRLEDAGHEVVVCPLIAIARLGPDSVDCSAYDWVVVTSPNGAAELVQRLSGRPRRIAAIGPGTAAVLRAHGMEPDLVPTVSTQEGLLAEFPRTAGRVLFAGAEGARRLLAEELGADVLVLYRTKVLRPAAFPDGDLVVLASASAARAYGALGRSVPAVSIGPETTGAAHEARVHVVAEAGRQDVDGLVEAVVSAAAER